MPPPDQSGRMRLDRETLMPMGVVVSLLMGAWGIGSRMADVSHEVAMLRRDLSQMQRDSTESMTRREWRAWVIVLRAQNPTLTIPDLPG